MELSRVSKAGWASLTASLEINNVHAFVTCLKSSTVRRDLQWGRRIHANVMECGSDSSMYVVTALIKMYANCGSMVDAHCLFDSIQKPDVVAWNVLLMGYAENWEGFASLKLFSRMKALGCIPDSVTFISALKACTSLAMTGNAGCLEMGREIQSEIGCHLNHCVQSTLIDTFAKCGSMVDAHHVFDSIKQPDVVSWTALLLGYAENGEGFVALNLFARMLELGFLPNSVTYIAALKACTSLAMKIGNGDKSVCLERGRTIHLQIGCHMNLHLQSTLIDMYAKCGSIREAHLIFDSIQTPDVVSWNALLLGYVDNGESHVTLRLFSSMKERGCVPDSLTYIAAIKACIALQMNGDTIRGECLKMGREIHSEVGCHSNHCVQSTLIDMYVKCGSLHDARLLFDSIQKPDVVSLNPLLLGYVENGEGLAALDLFFRLKMGGLPPDSVTYTAAIRASGLMGALAFGRNLHSEIIEFTTQIVTCLVDLYAKCGSMIEAREVFDVHSRQRDISTWTALLSGYGRIGDTRSVFDVFEAMQDAGFKPDSVTFVCILLCVSHAGLVVKAKEYFEAMTTHYGVTPTVVHYNCMVDVLGRANQLDEAIVFLCKMPCNPDTVTWKAVLAASHKWKNVEVGRMAFLSLVCMDNNDSFAHVLMAHLCGSIGMWEEQDRVLKFRTQCLIQQS